MLIRRLRARNFMKFRDLEFTDIPASGLVGIEGRNEGGKSTIGELVQFAIFGKTLSSQAASLVELIHWDEDDCSVELDFDIATGDLAGEYRISRQIDRYGTNFTRLLERGSGREIASGIIKVDAEMSRLARFDFEDFTHSFFLSEREFPRSPTQMREFLDRMFGIDALVDSIADVNLQVNEHEADFSKLVLAPRLVLASSFPR